MANLICGSLAYDTIMVFPDQFKRHILPEQVHILNVSFLVPSLRREFGGCAGNIAYNLKLLGGEPLIMATAGRDFGPYQEWLARWGIDTRHILVLDEHYTAQAFITTDLDDNQITAFHPGAMSEAHLTQIRQAPLDAVSWGIVSPDGREAMLQHAAQFAEAGIPFIFDPGQGLPMFDGPDLLNFFELASVVTVNDYESKLIEARTGLTAAQLAERVEALIITRGEEGSLILANGQMLEVPPARPAQVLDPTGCGDAYRAGLLFGLEQGMDLQTTARVASLMGAIKIETHGTQNHTFAWSEFSTRFAENFGYSCE
ncbi:MAG: carbohydrate kinase family protein [Pseudomonadota bacterium]|uniref:carbohydrate kinase family protein n=1 Tax=Thermithiobacillus tepidarius TaxID=929 RepID=UPI0004216274|nr:carbohydrate kinase family protein [Thermithiobacillus tepidarius]